MHISHILRQAKDFLIWQIANSLSGLRSSVNNIFFHV